MIEQKVFNLSICNHNGASPRLSHLNVSLFPRLGRLSEPPAHWGYVTTSPARLRKGNWSNQANLSNRLLLQAANTRTNLIARPRGERERHFNSAGSRLLGDMRLNPLCYGYKYGKRGPGRVALA